MALRIKTQLFIPNDNHKLFALQTSLLLSLLSELPLSSGSVHITGKIAYIPQEPWIFSASVRQNILFGRLFDSELYDNVIRASALKPV